MKDLPTDLSADLAFDGPDGFSAQTHMVRGGLARSGHSETSEALYLNSGYVYGAAEEAEAAFDGSLDRYVYSRFANPTVSVFETRLALAEGATHCRATASGMAAVNAALMSLVKTGDRVVAAKELFGSCSWIVSELLPKFGVQTEFVAAEDDAAWEEALSRPAKAVFLESPSNPNLRVIDLRKVAALSHQAGAKLVVDNAFATPYLQRPLALGADIVIHSATKFIDGQGRTMGGAVLTNDPEYVENDLGPFLRHTGPCIAPFNAWTMLKGLETLGLRMDRHCANALAVAKLLEAHPAVAQVFYPGLESHPRHAVAMGQMSQGGAVLALDLAGGKEAA
ncbi:MAG: trans-sulfuration enzyme family protein, partial [Rhodospirillaceae bacterium]